MKSAAKLFKRNGDWWMWTATQEFRLLDVAPTLEAEALTDSAHIRLREFIAAESK